MVPGGNGRSITFVLVASVERTAIKQAPQKESRRIKTAKTRVEACRFGNPIKVEHSHS